MSSLPLETERKYLIAMPEPGLLDALGFSRISITQTYLLCPDEGASSRVRRSVENGLTSYTATEKRRITDITRVELERSITSEEYGRLLALADPSLKVIEKLRRTAKYDGMLLEIDIYPFWSDRAVLETELPDEDRPVRLPDYLRVIREVSSDKRYTNRSLAASVPFESI